MQETQFRSLGQEDPLLEKEMATHSGILAWRIPWTEDPGGLQSMGSQGDTPEWLTLSALLLVFQAGGHSPVIWGHSNLTSPGLSLHSTGAGNLWSRPERELLTELVWAGQPSWAWPCHCSPSPPSIKVGGSGRLPPSPNPRKWLASSLLLQSHPPPTIPLPRIHLWASLWTSLCSGSLEGCHEHPPWTYKQWACSRHEQRPIPRFLKHISPT